MFVSSSFVRTESLDLSPSSTDSPAEQSAKGWVQRTWREIPFVSGLKIIVLLWSQGIQDLTRSILQVHPKSSHNASLILLAALFVCDSDKSCAGPGSSPLHQTVIMRRDIQPSRDNIASAFKIQRNFQIQQPGSFTILEFVLFSSPSFQRLTLMNLGHSHFHWWPNNPLPVQESKGEVHFVWLYPWKTLSSICLYQIYNHTPAISTRGIQKHNFIMQFVSQRNFLSTFFFNYFYGSLEFNNTHQCQEPLQLLSLWGSRWSVCLQIHSHTFSLLAI